MHLWAGLRRKYGQRRVRKREIPVSSLLLTSLDWTLRSKVTEEELNRVSWNSKNAGSNPNSSSSPVQPVAGRHASQLILDLSFCKLRFLTTGADSCAIHPGQRRCSCPWWQHLWGRRAATQPPCESASLGHSVAEQVSSADGPVMSWSLIIWRGHKHHTKVTITVWFLVGS